jgi:hypothetical protein
LGPAIALESAVAGTLASFVASTVYYIASAKQRMKLSPAAAADMKRPLPPKMLAEIGRNLILAFVTAQLSDLTQLRRSWKTTAPSSMSEYWVTISTGGDRIAVDTPWTTSLSLIVGFDRSIPP